MPAECGQTKNIFGYPLQDYVQCWNDEIWHNTAHTGLCSKEAWLQEGCRHHQNLAAIDSRLASLPDGYF